jgi:hypothetical protein
MDTLNVQLSEDRTKEGTATLIVNGKNVTLEGGSNVLGLGVGSATNPNKDVMKKSGNTPTGEAVVTKVSETDPKGEVFNADGTPVKNVDAGKLNKYTKAYGRFFIHLDPKSGDLLKSNRSGIGGHGGGTKLGKDVLNAKQKLVPTVGCLRFTNQTAAQLAKQSKDALNNNREFRWIIKEEEE